MSINQDHEVIVGFTTESTAVKGRYGVFDTSVTPRFGATDKGTVQYDKVREARGSGHAYDLARAINNEPKTGPKAALAKRAFDSRWKEPVVDRGPSGFGAVRAASFGE